MKSLDLNHWYVDEDKLSISLMRYFIQITPQINESIFYRLEVINSNKNQLLFNFYTLEDAITFTEETITNCKNLNEIINIYKEDFSQGKYRMPKKKIFKNKRSYYD